MKKNLIVIIFALALVMESTYARSMANLSIDTVGAYSYSGDGGYFSGMSSVDNWRFGFGSTFRFFSMTLETVLMKFPYSTEKDQLAILCLPGLSLSLSSLTAFELGFGPSLGLLVPKSGNSESDYQYVLADGSVEDSDASFSDLFMKSRLFWKFGLSAQVGNFALHGGYMCPAAVSFSTLSEVKKASDLFQTDEGMLFASMSFDLY